MLIHGDHSWVDRACGVEYLFEKAFGYFGITFGTQQKVQRIALRIDRTIKILPLSSDFYTRIVREPLEKVAKLRETKLP